jgi:2-hydroxychromene-2-carboxylate isomerase
LPEKLRAVDSPAMSRAGVPEPERIPVLYDFASTICYVAHRVLQGMEDDLAAVGVVLEWSPVDFCRIAGWRRGAEIGGPRRDNALRVARELGVEARMPREWIDSRRANAVALALAGGSKEAAWRERVWSAIFEEGRDVGEPEEIRRLGQDLGFDALALCDDRQLERLEGLTEAARDRGLTGIPAFVLGGYPLAGIHPPEQMLSLFCRYVARRRGRSDPRV